MEISNLLLKETAIHKHFPPCMTQPECCCFELQDRSISTESEANLYIEQTINQIELYINIAKTHLNKDAVVEIPYASKTSADIFKKMVHSYQHTRRVFQKDIQNDKRCYIDFPNKPVQVRKYLYSISLFCDYFENIIETLLNPSSKLTISSLKTLLDSHLELLFIFEQYQRVKKLGYTYISETKSGAINYFQLFFCDIEQ